MQVYQVSEVTRYLRERLEADELLQDLWVEGEVSNLRSSSLGHFYFTLKDAASELHCVLFQGHIQRGTRPPENGAQVTVHGRISLYETRGSLQLYVDMVLPSGLGVLYLQFEKLKKQLEEEGLLDVARKRSLPAFPRCIGVVTSPTGAVIHDIINVTGRRYPAAEIILSPALVQGAGAAESICQALQALTDHTDCQVILLARGGGSLEELWPFNEEKVARAIYACPVPVVTGIGHETDVTIADLVADVRAPTPSAAAELAVPDREECRARVREDGRRLLQMLRSLLEEKRAALVRAQHSFQWASPAQRLASYRQQLDEAVTRMLGRVQNRLAVERERVAGRQRQLGSLNPTAVLERGYSLCRHLLTLQVVRSVQQVSPGDGVEVRVSDGAFWGKVYAPGARRGRT